MIEIVADKDIPFLKEVFKGSKFFYLNALPFNEINNVSLKNAQGLLSRSATILNNQLVDNTDLKFIFSLTSGENHIDYDSLISREIFIKTAKGANAQAVLEYTLAALKFSSEKKIGLIGEGHIGSKIKKVLSFFNYEVISYDPYKFRHDDKQKKLALDCPLISVNASYSKKGDYPSHKLITELKKNQILINTSRGEVVDYRNILKTCEAKLICDVWNNEPNLNTDDIKPTFLGTPHIAGNTLESKVNALNLAVDSLKDFFETDDLISLELDKNTFHVDASLINEDFDNGKIPHDFIDQFINLEDIDRRFKQDLYFFENEMPFPQYFQFLRKKNERPGFGDFYCSFDDLTNKNRELLTLLGFKIE